MDLAYPALFVPVREVDTMVRSRVLAGASPTLRSGDGPLAGLPLVAPFASTSSITEGVLSDLERYFLDVSPFDFELTGVAAFSDRTPYLVAEPASAFLGLVRGLAEVFPELTPFAGDVCHRIPHVSVPLAPGETRLRFDQALSARLPIAAYAGRALLVDQSPAGEVRTVAEFHFGSTAA